MALDAFELPRPLRPALVPVPAGQRGVCHCCHGAAASDWHDCYPCSQARSVLGELPDVLPMTMSLHLTQMHHVLRDYKDGRIDVRERFTLQLAALSTVVLLQHGACLGPWDDGTTIPSVRRNAPLTVLTRVPPSLYGEHRAVLTPRRADFGRDVDASRFTVSGDVQGDRVLLFEDTFVSGGATFSATAALRAAGATVVGPLIIGRHVRADWAPSVEMLSWLRAVPWSEDTCARCGGAGQEPASLF